MRFLLLSATAALIAGLPVDHKHGFLGSEKLDSHLKKPVKATSAAERDLVIEDAPGVGSWAGTCKCPSGETYQAGDNNDNCASLACVGGVSSGCGEGNPGGKTKVICAEAGNAPSIECDPDDEYSNCSEEQPCKSSKSGDDVMCDEDCFPRYSEAEFCDPNKVKVFALDFWDDRFYKNDDPREMPTLSNVAVSPTRTLEACEGDCDSDDDCAAGLFCFERGFGGKSTTAYLPNDCGDGGLYCEGDDTFYCGSSTECSSSSDTGTTVKCSSNSGLEYNRCPTSDPNGKVPGCQGQVNLNWDYCTAGELWADSMAAQSVVQMTKTDDPDFGERCETVLKDGSGFCQMFFSPEHAWYRKIRSVKVPTGCWLRVYTESSHIDSTKNGVMDIHGTRKFSDILMDVPSFKGALKEQIVGFKLTGYNPYNIGRVLALSSGAAQGTYTSDYPASFLPVGSFRTSIGHAFEVNANLPPDAGIEGTGPASKLATCGSLLHSDIGAMTILPGTSVTLYSKKSLTGKTKRLLSGTWSFMDPVIGTARAYRFTDDDNDEGDGPGSFRISTVFANSDPSDAEYRISAGWTMYGSVHKSNTDVEWPMLTYGYETTDETSQETTSESSTEMGTESSYGSNTETAASMSLTASMSTEVSVGAPIGPSVDVEVGLESTIEGSHSVSSSEEHSSSHVQSNSVGNAVASSAGQSKGKGMECPLQCAIPSSLHDPVGNKEDGLAPVTEVNDGIGHTCPEATKIADPNIYIWYWHVNLERPNDPTSNTKIDMCIAQCTCTPIPPACPVGQCADEYCTTCKPPSGCPALRVTTDGKFMEVQRACIMGYGQVDGEISDDGTGEFPVRQYRKKGAVWVKVHEGTMHVDLTGPFGDSTILGVGSSSTMEGDPVGNAVGTLTEGEEIVMGDYFSFQPVGSDGSMQQKKKKKHNARLLREHMHNIVDQHMQGMNFIRNGTHTYAVPKANGKKTHHEKAKVERHDAASAPHKEFIHKAHIRPAPKQVPKQVSKQAHKQAPKQAHKQAHKRK